MLLPGATVIGVVPAVNEKSEAFTPETCRFEIVRLPLPGFEIVTVIGALATPGTVSGNVTELLLELIFGTVPVPESDTECGLPLALSLMLRLAVRDPSAVGLKLTLTVVLLPAEMLIGKAGALKLKSVVLESVAPEMVKVAFPVLVTVKVLVTVLPTGWGSNVKLAGARLTDGFPLGPGALTLVPPHAASNSNEITSTKTGDRRRTRNVIWDLGQPGGGGRHF